jgi:hypothetical protein
MSLDNTVVGAAALEFMEALVEQPVPDELLAMFERVQAGEVRG